MQSLESNLFKYVIPVCIFFFIFLKIEPYYIHWKTALAFEDLKIEMSWNFCKHIYFKCQSQKYFDSGFCKIFDHESWLAILTTGFDGIFLNVS